MAEVRVSIEEPTISNEIEEIPIRVFAAKGDPGTDGQDGFSPTVETSKTGRTTTITITDKNGAHTATILDGADGTGSGDMSKATYDKNNNGIVDNAEKVNSHTVNDDVPSGFFTGGATASVEGTSVELTDAIRLKSVELKGDSDQDGTPTPDSPVNVQVVTGTQTVTVNGKNLCNFGTDTFTRLKYYALPKPLEAGTYTFSAIVQSNDTTYNTCLVRFMSSQSGSDIAPNRNIARSTGRTSVTVTTNATMSGIYLYSSTGASTSIGISATFADMQIEKSSTASSYEPYQSQPYTINLGSTELCKIGDYQDYIYKSGDDWYVHKEVNSKTFDGTESWTYNQNKYMCYTAISDIYRLNIYGSRFSVTDNFTNRSDYLWSNPTDVDYGFLINNQYFYIRNKDCANANDLKTWLSTHNTTLYYPLATPTDTKITNATLIGQLEALAGTTLYAGGTMASSGTLPAIISAETLLQTRNGMLEAIAAGGTTYTAGTGISITNGVISCTFADGDTEEY